MGRVVNLPRLQRLIAVADKAGLPTLPFQQWWQALVVAVEDLFTSVSGRTGWAVYVHGGGAQSLAAATRTQLLIDGATKNETQLPTDTGPLWASNAITGRNGDGVVIKVQCIFTPTDATATELVMDVDIGGTVGIVEYRAMPTTNGSGVAHYISWTFAAYTLDTWEANGGKVYATADGPGDITDLRIVIQRTHKAR